MNTRDDLKLTGQLKNNSVAVDLPSSSGTMALTSDVSTAIATAQTSSKYSAVNPALTGVDGVCTWKITHNLSDWDVIVQLREAATNKIIVFADMVVNPANVVTITINADSIAASAYKVLVKK